METENRQESLFADSLTNLQTDNYLGDRLTIQAVLRYALGQVSTKLEDGGDGQLVVSVVRPWSRWLSKVFLGQDNDYKPIHKWNEPGAIDEFCAKWIGSSETDPELRMEHVFVKFFNEILDLAEYAGTDGVLDEQWLFQMDLILENYINLLLGIDPATQRTITLGNEEPGEDNGVEE